LFFLLNQSLLIYDAAKSETASFREFFNVIEVESIGLRIALGSATDYSGLKSNIELAVKNAIENIRQGNQDKSTMEELQFAYLFLHKWEHTLAESGNPNSGSEYVALAQATLDGVKNKMKAPTEEAKQTAEFVVEKIIELLSAASTCAKAMPEFIVLVNKHGQPIYQGFEEGLTKYISLEKIRKLVSAATQIGLNDLAKCKRPFH